MADVAVLIVMADPRWAIAGSGRPFHKADNREIFLRTIELYANRERVEQRILCVLPDDLSRVSSRYGANLGFQGVTVSAGGPDWFGTVGHALGKLDPQIKWVVIHDASCPATPQTLLDELEEAVTHTGAACPVTVVQSLMAKSNKSGQALSPAVVRGYHIQSPCIFSRELICRAYESRGASAVDDCELVEAAGGKLHPIEGAPLNMRIDSDAMARLAGDLLRHLPKPKPRGPISPFDEAQW